MTNRGLTKGRPQWEEGAFQFYWGQETLASRCISGICSAGEIRRVAGVLKTDEWILEGQRELPQESGISLARQK